MIEQQLLIWTMVYVKSSAFWLIQTLCKELLSTVLLNVIIDKQRVIWFSVSLLRKFWLLLHELQMEKPKVSPCFIVSKAFAGGKIWKLRIKVTSYVKLHGILISKQWLAKSSCEDATVWETQTNLTQFVGIYYFLLSSCCY